MYFRDLQCNDERALMPDAAVLRLPIRIGSRDPETAIVRPVGRRLSKRGIAKTVGWRVWTAGEGEVVGVEISLSLAQPTRAGLTDVARCLSLAPIGSSVRFSAGGDPVVFGGSEAVEVTLPPVDPQAGLAARCARALSRDAQLRGWSRTGAATRLYVYGPRPQAIAADIRSALGDVEVRSRS